MSANADLRLAFRRMYLSIADMVMQQVDERLGNTIRGGKVQGSTISGTIPLAAVPAHQQTHQSGHSDALAGLVDANARVAVANGGSVVGTRRGVNLIAGNGLLTLSGADNAGAERVDQTLTVNHDALANLTDAAIAGPTDKQLVRYQASSGKWINASEKLGDLADVQLTGPTDAQILYYQASSGKWINRDNGGGGGGGGGGNVTSTGAIGSEPGSPSDGDLYFPTDAVVLERYNGTAAAWEKWVSPVGPVKPPVLANFSWVNQSGTSATAQQGGLYLYRTGNPGNLSLLVKAIPNSGINYTVTAGLIPQMPSSTWAYAGICLRNSSSGNFVTAGVGVTGGGGVYNLIKDKWNSPTSWGGGYGNLALTCLSQPVWVRFQDDGTNRIWSVSYDGHNFYPLASVSRTDFITPDQVGLFISVDVSSSLWAAALYFDYRETAP